MGDAGGVRLRVATPADAAAVSAVLASAYGALMAPDYDRAVMAAALPGMTRANPALLGSGTYHVAETEAGRIVACGGWTLAAPGTGVTAAGVGHVRHFGTHADWTRRGFGRAIFERCREEALAASVRSLLCFSSLGAAAFYASLGFVMVERTETLIGGGLRLSSITMAWTARQARSIP